MPVRRLFVQSLLITALAPATVRRTRAAEPGNGPAEKLLSQGGAGLVVAMRHALAPGTFDPPGFRLDDCGTQRNLDDEGRAQARRIGVWYRERKLAPSVVRSSEWCRCLDTGHLAFGNARRWPSLNSVIGDRSGQQTRTAALRAELARLAASDAPGFEVWVTHQANIVALVGNATGSGEAVLLRHDRRSEVPAVLATLSIA